MVWIPIVWILTGWGEVFCEKIHREKKTPVVAKDWQQISKTKMASDGSYIRCLLNFVGDLTMSLIGMSISISNLECCTKNRDLGFWPCSANIVLWLSIECATFNLNGLLALTQLDCCSGQIGFMFLPENFTETFIPNPDVWKRKQSKGTNYLII